MIKFAVFATGYKGYKFLKGLEYRPAFVVSYNNKERQDKMHYSKIIDWCENNNVILHNRRQFLKLKNITDSLDKIFVIGWQYLINENLEKLVVFHDSYLPERRGFAPTISSLLECADYLGATSFMPIKTPTVEPDYGNVYYRKKRKISYPIKLKEAFDLVVELYIEMAHNLLKKEPTPEMIDYDNSTFSLWRDKEDLRIDWSADSKLVQQKIFSLSFPYMGATTIYDDQTIHIQESEEVNDINFVNTKDHYGKIWKIEHNCPYIVCGKGAIKIIKAVDTENKEILFNRIRKRLK